MCTERDIREAAIKYSDMLYRICTVMHRSEFPVGCRLRQNRQPCSPAQIV